MITRYKRISEVFPLLKRGDIFIYKDKMNIFLGWGNCSWLERQCSNNGCMGRVRHQKENGMIEVKCFVSKGRCLMQEVIELNILYLKDEDLMI